MKEIEVKVRVDDFSDVTTKLEKLGCKFSESRIQNDRIFLHESIPFNEIRSGVNVLRIRKSNGKVKLTLKQPQANNLDRIEREVIVSDAKQIEDILDLMGYKEVVKVNKKRRSCKYNDYEVCLDEVDELGKFIEVERMSEGDGEKIQEELMAFLEGLGIDRNDREFQAYDIQVWNKNNSKKMTWT
jgi:adenylate cyclase, class 2